MTDIAITAALMFGFALTCVITVVYLMSKRQINVTQNNSTNVTATERNASSHSGPGRVERALIKWTFIALVAGVAIAAAANVIHQASTSITMATQAAPVAQPAPAAPLRTPSPVGEGWGEGLQGREGVSPLTIAVPILALAAIGIWSYVIATALKIKLARRPASPAQREQHLESILPEAVNQL